VLEKSQAIMGDFMKHDLRGKPISIIADAVWTNIDGGQSILFVYASSPELDGTGEVLLGERKFLTHSAENQAQIIVDILRQYGIQKRQLMWFCGDNIATNRKTARILQVPFANCLPHSLGLVLQKFLSKFKVTSCMPLLSTFVTLGVSMHRRQLFTAFGLMLTKVDYSVTRWQGLLEAMIYLVGNIDKKRDDYRKSIVEKNRESFEKLKDKVRRSALEFARKEEAEVRRKNAELNGNKTILQDVKDNGGSHGSSDDVDLFVRQPDENEDDEDVSLHAVDTAFAVDGVDFDSDELDDSTGNLPSVWRQFYQFVLAADRDTITSRKTMEFLADWTAYTEALLVTQCLQSLPAIISDAEGGHSYTSSASHKNPVGFGQQTDDLGRQVAEGARDNGHDETIINLESRVTSFMNGLRLIKDDADERNRRVTSALTAAKLGAKRYFYANVSTDVTSPLEPDELTENLKRVEKVIDNCRVGLNIRLKAACDEIFQTRLESSGVFVNNWVHDALQRLKLRRIFLLRDPFPKLVYKTSSTSHDSATWDFLKPLLPMVMSDDDEIIYPDEYQGCSQTDFHDAYTELRTVINGNGIRDELVAQLWAGYITKEDCKF
jgi:hypothetical protein